MSIKCPQCFHLLPPQPQFLLCEGSCAPAHDEDASRVLGFGVSSRPLVRPEPTSGPDVPPEGTCAACQNRTLTEACPQCHYGIAPLWRHAVITCIAMAGARSTGKSLLVATGKLQLEVLAETFWSSDVESLGTTARRFDEVYLKPLREQRKLVQPTVSIGADTSATREPFVFRFTQRRGDRSRARILVLKDVAGEDLENNEANRRQLSFLSRADMVFVMVDPLKVPEIRAVLADLVPGSSSLGGEPLPVLTNVLNHMTGHVPGAATDIPVALILSKFDIMQKLREVNSPRWSSVMSRAGAAMMRDPSLSAADYNKDDGDRLDREVRSLLDRLKAGTLVATLDTRAPHNRFFAASALGEAPDGDLVSAGGIAPFRVLDPIKWALAVTG